MEMVTGEKIEIGVSEIEKIDFEQHVRNMNSAAQEGAWKIFATPGHKETYKVPAQLLKIESGVLTLKPSWRVSVDSGSQETKPSNVLPNSSESVAEAKVIRPDALNKLILVEIENVTYTKQFLGGGGSSGIKKGLQ